jgi:hypothetical protein
MQQSAIEEINDLKVRIESMAERAKARAIATANEAISVLREAPLSPTCRLGTMMRPGNCSSVGIDRHAEILLSRPQCGTSHRPGRHGVV